MEHIKQDQIINIPNALTVVRILLLPVVVWRFMIGDATGALIDEATAKLTAVNQVPGASTSDIYEWKLDYDDGRWEYEGKIIYGGTEYEFTIAAASGTVTDWAAETLNR